MNELQILQNSHLQHALEQCREAAASLAPPEYDRLVAELSSSLASPPGLQRLFIEQAQALRYAVIHRYLDEELQALQYELHVMCCYVDELAAAAQQPLGLSALDRSGPKAEVSWPNDELPAPIEPGVRALEGFVMRVARELEEAAQVQRLLLPKHDQLTTEAAHLAAFYRPAQGCGGDFWAAERLPDKRLLVVVGDVTGHGSAAAIITGIARASLDSLLTSGVEITCDGLLTYLNRTLYRIVGGEVLMTAVATLIDPERGEMVTANAGNPLPYVIARGGLASGQVDSELRQIVVHGTPLGAARDSTYEVVTSPLAAGDLILWYTDGVPECRNRAGAELGERALRALLRTSDARSARHLRDQIVDKIAHFSADAVLSDDITIVSGLIMPMQRR